jgi:predicted nucleotidyltransferase
MVISIGNTQVDAAVQRLIKDVEELMPDGGLGFYLHGSWASGASEPGSDVDVLALSWGSITPALKDKVKGIAADIAVATGVPLDFHIHPAASLIADPMLTCDAPVNFCSASIMRRTSRNRPWTRSQESRSWLSPTKRRARAG